MAEAQKEYISKVKLPKSETIYFMKDIEARAGLAALEALLKGTLILDCGTSTTNVDDADDVMLF
jgi:hypothetical protein